jgi:hypothetical protein
LKLQLSTLSRWENIPWFNKEVNRLIKQRLLKRKASIFEVVGKSAEGRDYRFIKMAFELMGLYPLPKPSAPVKTAMEPYTLEEYHQAMAGVAAWNKENSITEKDFSP